MNTINTPRYVVAEFCGSLMLGFLIGLAELNFDTKSNVNYVYLSFTCGLVMTVVSMMFLNKSGSHFNPLLTFSLMISKRMENKKGIIYMISQILGYFFSCLLLKVYFPQLDYDKKQETFGFAYI